MPDFVKICVKKMPLRDLKGRMPERSEWLLAEGAAKRNPRIVTLYLMREEREYRLPRQRLSRLPDAFLLGLLFWGLR